MIDNSVEYILCAAIHFDDGTKHWHQPVNIETGFVVYGRRHHNCLAVMHALGKRVKDGTQGFLTSHDRFVDRQNAVGIAKVAGQIPATHTGNLFSEDLY